MTGYHRLYELSLSSMQKRKRVIVVKKKREGPPGCTAHEQSEFSDASHQRADQPDHHDRRDDAHYHVHDFFHFQAPFCPYLTVYNYEML
jgi:hypothetical protein